MVVAGPCQSNRLGFVSQAFPQISEHDCGGRESRERRNNTSWCCSDDLLRCDYQLMITSVHVRVR